MFETGQFSRLWRQVAERFGILVDYLPGTWRTGAVIADIEAKTINGRCDRRRRA
jgi:alanine-glyoxylate transaminase/serine-glyoxylate transaminase/serine-pyruvate transaminase